MIEMTGTDNSVRVRTEPPYRTSVSREANAVRDWTRHKEEPRFTEVTFVSRGKKVQISWPDPQSCLPKWFNAVGRGTADLLTLPSNWDSYGAEPIQLEVVRAALSFLSRHLEHDSHAPWIVPMSDGGIQLEWSHDDKEIEVVIAPEGEISAFWFDDTTDDERELDISAETDVLKKYIALMNL